MVFNTTFNNISVISWQSVLLMEETGVPGENHQPAVSHWRFSIFNIFVVVFFGFRCLRWEVVGSLFLFFLYWWIVANYCLNSFFMIGSWSNGNWIHNYQCNQCLSPLKLWVRIQLILDTTLCNKVCQWLTAGWWFSPGTPVSSINKTDCHDPYHEKGV
jgi:hypothetical protein